MIEFIQFFTLLLTLLVATVHDLRVRKVPPLIWFPALVVGICVNVMLLQQQYATLPSNWFFGYVLMMVIGIMITLCAATILRYKFYFGGADIKGILVVGLMYATAPWLILTTIFIACLSSTTIGIKYKTLPWIPSLTLGFLLAVILFGGII